MIPFADLPPPFAGPWRLLLPLVAAAVGIFLLLPRPRPGCVGRGGLRPRGPGLGGVVCYSAWMGDRRPRRSCSSPFRPGRPWRGAADHAEQPGPRRVVLRAGRAEHVRPVPAASRPVPDGRDDHHLRRGDHRHVPVRLMLAQQTGFSDADDRTREPFLASFAGFVLLGALLLMLDHTFPDGKSFNELLERAAAAADQATVAGIRAELGNRDQFLEALRREEKRLRGTAHATAWNEAVDDLGEALNSDQCDRRRTQGASSCACWPSAATFGRTIALRTCRRRQRRGPGPTAVHRLPAAGRAGRHLLLVATIGAIAIAHRRAGRHCDESRLLATTWSSAPSCSCLGHDRLPDPPQPDHHVPVGRDDAAGRGAQPRRLRPHHGNLHGQAFTLFILTVAACEAGIALALILMLYRRKGRST